MTAGTTARGPAMPNFRIPRLLGIFNVIFASEIMICGLGMGVYVTSLPLLGRMISQAQKQVERQAEAAKTAELASLSAQEEQAKTDAEKAEIVTRRAEVNARPKGTIPGTMDLNKMGFDDPVLLRWSWTEVMTGLVVNAMMLASGVGLLFWKPWARTLGVWTAAIKVVRLTLLYSYCIVAVVPPMSERLGRAVGEMMTSQQQAIGRASPPISTDMFVKVYTVMYSGMALGTLVLGVIYPVILLWFLTRPGVKVACSGLVKLPKEPNQP